MKLSQIPFPPSRPIQLAASTSIGLGIYWCMNQLSAAKLTAEEKIALSWIIPAAELVNQIWKQTLVSQLPEARSNKILKVATDPKTFIVAYLASKFMEAPYLEWPTAVVTALVVGAHSLKSCVASIHEQRGLALIPVHLFNAVGTGLLTLDVLGIREIVNREEWEKAMQPIVDNSHLNAAKDAEVKRIEEDAAREQAKADAAFNKKKAEDEKAAQEKKDQLEKEINELRESSEQLNKEVQELLDGINDSFNFKKGQTSHIEPENCPPAGTFDPSGLFPGGANFFQRLTHKELNPDCVEHAKFIFAQSKLDQASSGFQESSDNDACNSINKLHRKLGLATNPDKNKGNPLANDANANINKAYDTLKNTFCAKSL